MNASVLLASLSLVACGGGGGTVDTLGTVALESPVLIANSPGLPLYQQLLIGPETVFPGNPTLSGNSIDISIDSSLNVALLDSEGSILQTFDASGADGDPFNDELTTWFKNDGKDAFAWLIPFDFSAPPAIVDGLDYTTYGVWVLGASQDTRSDVVGTVTVQDAGVVSLGSVTPPGFLPTSGTAIYQGGVAAYDADCLDVIDLLDGQATFAVDFLDQTVQASIDLFSGPDLNYARVTSEAMPINTSNQFQGQAQSNRGHTGTMSGFFTGPSAEELGGQFDLKGEGELQLIGAFGATNLSSPLD